MGMAMIYNIASALKAWLDDNNISSEQKQKMKILKEEEELQVCRSFVIITITTCHVLLENIRRLCSVVVFVVLVLLVLVSYVRIHVATAARRDTSKQRDIC